MEKICYICGKVNNIDNSEYDNTDAIFADDEGNSYINSLWDIKLEKCENCGFSYPDITYGNNKLSKYVYDNEYIQIRNNDALNAIEKLTNIQYMQYFLYGYICERQGNLHKASLTYYKGLKILSQALSKFRDTHIDINRKTTDESLMPKYKYCEIFFSDMFKVMMDLAKEATDLNKYNFNCWIFMALIDCRLKQKTKVYQILDYINDNIELTPTQNKAVQYIERITQYLS